MKIDEVYNKKELRALPSKHRRVFETPDSEITKVEDLIYSPPIVEKLTDLIVREGGKRSAHEADGILDETVDHLSQIFHKYISKHGRLLGSLKYLVKVIESASGEERMTKYRLFYWIVRIPVVILFRRLWIKKNDSPV